MAKPGEQAAPLWILLFCLIVELLLDVWQGRLPNCAGVNGDTVFDILVPVPSFVLVFL